VGPNLGRVFWKKEVRKAMSEAAKRTIPNKCASRTGGTHRPAETGENPRSIKVKLKNEKKIFLFDWS